MGSEICIGDRIWFEGQIVQLKRRAGYGVHFLTLRDKLAGANDPETIIGDPIGRDALVADLRHELIAYTPEQLIELAERELAWCQRRPRVQVLLPPLPEPIRVAGQDVEAPRLVVRGPWLLLRWHQDQRRQRLLFWPDVLDSGQRRELRLAVAARAVSRQPRTMAP